MSILSFDLPELLIILGMFLIFFVDKLGKFSLIFKILLTLGVDSWAYNDFFFFFFS